MGTTEDQFDPISFRVLGITDRDAPSLYCQAPERSLFTLWADKVDLEDSTDPAAYEDSLFVSEARKKFAAIVACSLQPMAVKNAAMPFIRAWVDGANLEKKLVARIALQSPSYGHARALDNSLLVRGGRVPERHWIELQHQMIALGFDHGYFVSTLGIGHLAVVSVPRDPVFCSNHVAECVLFWDFVRRAVPPPNAEVPADVDPDEGPGEEDGPWAPGWEKRTGQLPLTPAFSAPFVGPPGGGDPDDSDRGEEPTR